MNHVSECTYSSSLRHVLTFKALAMSLAPDTPIEFSLRLPPNIHTKTALFHSQPRTEMFNTVEFEMSIS